MQSDSVSSAPLRRTAFSRRRESSSSDSLCRPASWAGEVIGEKNSDEMVRMPSNCRSGRGEVTVQDMRAVTLVMKTKHVVLLDLLLYKPM